MSLMVSVNVKQQWTMLRHWLQFVPNMSTRHTRTHAHEVGSYNEKKTTDQYAVEKRWVFSLFKKRVKNNSWQREEESSRSQAQYIQMISSLGSSCPSEGCERSEYLRLSEESEKESRAEGSQRGMEELYQRHCEQCQPHSQLHTPSLAFLHLPPNSAGHSWLRHSASKHGA